MASDLEKGLMGLVGMKIAPKVLPKVFNFGKDIVGKTLDIPSNILGGIFGGNKNQGQSPISEIYKRTGQNVSMTRFHQPNRPSGILSSFRGMFDRLLG